MPADVPQTEKSKAWGGRFSQPTNAFVQQFTASIAVDQRLWRHDVDASLAHAAMLGAVGLITPEEAQALASGLKRVATRLGEGTLPFSISLEDIHMHIEAALIEDLGDVGRKLHTARSRNDQVATSLRLWTRDALDQLIGGVDALQAALVDSAARHAGVVMPGYTHLQRAQPILAAHSLLAHVERLARDRSRLLDARSRVNVLPLGSAALAGTSLPIDRDFVASLLGFDAVAPNSLDATSDRDFVAEALFVMSMTAIHLGSLAEEWIIYSTSEFGFIELPDALCTGSSIMPQKKNPDVLELVRGKAARVIGALQSTLVLLKSLPMAYNRDLQEDKAPLFDAFDAVSASLAAMTQVVTGMRFKREAIGATLDRGFLDATTAMEGLISLGLPMRTAHEQIGRLVRQAEELGLVLADLPESLLAAVHPDLPALAPKLFGVYNSLNALRSSGSSGPGPVAASVDRWQDTIRARAGACRGEIDCD